MATKTFKRATQDTVDAVELLRGDHRNVEKLFKEFEKADRADGEGCRAIVEQACAELQVHAQIEEEIFYPAVRAALDEEDLALLDEAEVEHASAKQLIAQLEALEPADPHYAATFTVLSEYVQHHVKEEEGEMFPRAKKAKVDFESLGEQMMLRKEELLEDTAVASAPEA